MSYEAYADWKAECEAIHKEMDQVVRSAWLQTTQEREIRRRQYMALIERRDAAARKFLRPTPRGRDATIGAPKAAPPTATETVVNVPSPREIFERMNRAAASQAAGKVSAAPRETNEKVNPAPPESNAKANATPRETDEKIIAAPRATIGKVSQEAKPASEDHSAKTSAAGSPDDIAAFLMAEVDAWGKANTAAGIKAG